VGPAFPGTLRRHTGANAVSLAGRRPLERSRSDAGQTVGAGTRLNRQLEAEQWRLIASLEHLLAGTRAKLGSELLPKIKREPGEAISLWSLARLGSRVPPYGPLHCVVQPKIAAQWVKLLLDLTTFTTATASAVVSIARRTGDRSRDIEEGVREQAISRLITAGMEDHVIQLISRNVPPERADAVRSFGESLPPDLPLVSSSNCLLSVPAFQNSGASSS
jgi:hypothetical protein